MSFYNKTDFSFKHIFLIEKVYLTDFLCKPKQVKKEKNMLYLYSQKCNKTLKINFENFCQKNCKVFRKGSSTTKNDKKALQLPKKCEKSKKGTTNKITHFRTH